MCRAFARLGHAPADLLIAAAAHAGAHLPDYQPQSIANLVWCVDTSPRMYNTEARLCTKFWPPKWLALQICAPPRLASDEYAVEESELNWTHWCRAYATLDMHPGHTFVARLLSRATDILQFFSAQNISNTVWCAVRTC